MEESKSSTATDNSNANTRTTLGATLSGTSHTNIAALSKKQQRVRRVQRRRELVLQQVLDRPPVTTDWTTLPNVLVTHIAQSYLSQESASNWHGKQRHQREVISFALTCRHWCRVLSASYRWYTERQYLVCDMKTMRLHVVDHEWQYDYDFDQIDRHSLASWSLPDGIEKYHQPPPPPEERVNNSIPSWLKLPPRQMKSKKMKKKKMQPRVSRFVTHAQRAHQANTPATATTSNDSDGAGGSAVAASMPAISVTEVLDEVDEDIASIHSPSAVSFQPGPIGRRVSRDVSVKRVYTLIASERYREKYGKIANKEVESQLQMGDLSWLSTKCERFALGPILALPLVPMTQFTRLHTIELAEVRAVDLKRTSDQWPPQLLTLRGIEIEGSDFDDIAPIPEELRFPPTLTELVIPQLVFSRQEYQSNPNLIPWPEGLQRLTYDGPKDLRDLILPHELTELTLTSHDIANVAGWHAPQNLKRLKFRGLNRSLAGIFWPPCLESLEFRYHWNQSLRTSQLPHSLLELKFGSDSLNQPPSEIVFPPRLISLTLNWQWEPAQRMENHEVLTFPDSITRLHLDRFWAPLAPLHLPSALIELHIESITHPLEGMKLPQGLKRLQFTGYFNEPVDKLLLPDSLESLRFNSTFNKPLVGMRLPPSLCHLSLGTAFNQSIRGWQLPDSLLVFDLGSTFNQPLKGIRLPSRLCEFHLPSVFSHVDSLMKLILPRTLRSMTLPLPENLRRIPSYQLYREYTEKLKDQIQLILLEKPINHGFW